MYTKLQIKDFNKKCLGWENKNEEKNRQAVVIFFLIIRYPKGPFCSSGNDPTAHG